MLFLFPPLAVMSLMGMAMYAIVKNYNARHAASAADPDLKPSSAAISTAFIAIFAVPVLFYKMHGAKGIVGALAFLGIAQLVMMALSHVVAVISV